MVLPLSIEFPWFSGITEFFGDMFQILCVHHLLMTFGKKRWIHKGKSHKSSLRFFLPLNVFFLSYPQKITICNSTAREIWLKSPSINLSPTLNEPSKIFNSIIPTFPDSHHSFHAIQIEES